MNKRRIEHLEQLVEFIQKDFHDISDGNEQHSLMALGSKLLGQPFYLVRDPEQTAGFSSWEELADQSKRLKELLEIIFFTTLKNGFLFYDRPMILPCLKSTFSVYQQSFAPKTDKKYRVWAFFSKGEPVEKGEFETLSEHPLEVYIDATGFAVLDALQELPFDRLKICPTCWKYFIQKTAREKKFCSDYCKVKKHVEGKKDRQLN